MQRDQDDELLRRHDPCSWMPPGGIAEVVLSRELPAQPTPVVRLLVLTERSLLTTARPDGGGRDLPTRRAAGSASSAVAVLTREHLAGDGHRPELLGFVRNTLPDAPAAYPWPAPTALFAVWVVTGQDFDTRHGDWLDLSAAESELQQRHWWPLAQRAIKDVRN